MMMTTLLMAKNEMNNVKRILCCRSNFNSLLVFGYAYFIILENGYNNNSIRIWRRKCKTGVLWLYLLKHFFGEYTNSCLFIKIMNKM